jgi:glycosyltransferase involved in cell wall biosynthesis
LTPNRLPPTETETSIWGPAPLGVRNPLVSSVSAFFPCYNDGQIIESVICRAHVMLEQLVDTFEIIVVDDGSHDNSLLTLRRLERDLPRLRIVAHDVNRGYGAALISGFAAAQYEWIFYTDGDGQYDPGEIATLFASVERSTDIVQGWKLRRSDSWYRTIIGRVYHHVVAFCFALDVRDTDCDFRLFRRELLERCPLKSTSGVICVEMMRRFHQADAHFVEVPVHHYPRRHGRSQFFRLPQIARAATQLGALWFRLVVVRHDERANRWAPVNAVNRTR